VDSRFNFRFTLFALPHDPRAEARGLQVYESLVGRAALARGTILTIETQ